MQFFGLIGLLVTMALAAWWLTSSGPLSVSPRDSEATESTYQESIDAAKEAADLLGGSAARSNTMVVVYDGFNVPTDTTTLDLSGRGLSGSLKAEIRHLSSLQELNLSRNNFTGLPAEVGQLSQLEILNLSHNPLTGLPQELGNLQKLRVLDLRGTDYSTFDLEIIRKNLPNSTQILVD
ncbi:MAG: hypothetical protein AAB388_00865 [Patescibacteria group bacterium]